MTIVISAITLRACSCCAKKKEKDKNKLKIWPLAGVSAFLSLPFQFELAVNQGAFGANVTLHSPSPTAWTKAISVIATPFLWVTAVLLVNKMCVRCSPRAVSQIEAACGFRVHFLSIFLWLWLKELWAGRQNEEEMFLHVYTEDVGDSDSGNSSAA